MSYFDMVANPVTVPAQEKLSLERLKHDVVKLKKDKDNGKYCVNAAEWRRGVNNALTNNDLGMFLVKHSNIPAPADQAQELQWKRQVDVHSSSQLSRIRSLVREEKIKKEIVKKEPQSQKDKEDDDLHILPGTPAKAEEKKKLEVDLTGSEGLVKVDRAKEVFARNAKWLAKEQKEQQQKQLSEGEALPVLFVDPLTRCYEGELDTAEIKIGEWWYELESSEKRRRRMIVWNLIVYTIGVVDKEIWRLVTVGDVYSLFNTIQDHLQTNQRSGIVHDLNKKMQNLSVVEGELFATFASRVRNLLQQSENVGLKFDAAVVRENLIAAILKSNNKVLKQHLELIQLEMDRSGQEFTALQIVSRLEKPMNRSEHRSARARQQGSASEEADSDSLRKSRKEKKREKKEKEKKEKEAAAAAAAAAAAGGTSLGRGATALKASTGASQSVLGVCLFFQDGKCEKGEKCSYEHRKLSAADKKKLEEKMEKKRAGIKCHKCGEKGHYASTCTAEKTVLSFSSSPSSSSSSNKQARARQALSSLVERSGLSHSELTDLALEILGKSSPVSPPPGAASAAREGGEDE